MMKVVTANRLFDGEVVWLGAGGRWVEDLGEAHLLETKEAEATALEEGAASAARQEVVDVYSIDVTVEEGVLIPVRFREQIRAAGPTMRLDLGKQARRRVNAA